MNLVSGYPRAAAISQLLHRAGIRRRSSAQRSAGFRAFQGSPDAARVRVYGTPTQRAAIKAAVCAALIGRYTVIGMHDEDDVLTVLRLGETALRKYGLE